MSNDSYVRELLKLPNAGPTFPVAWLLLPWAPLTVWAVKLGALILAASEADNGFVDFLTLGGLLRFQIVAGVTLLLTWALLYIAWPSHIRVFCWVASIAYLAGWILSGAVSSHTSAVVLSAVRPAVVAGCAIAAIVVQAYAARVYKAQITAPAV